MLTFAARCHHSPLTGKEALVPAPTTPRSRRVSFSDEGAALIPAGRPEPPTTGADAAVGGSAPDYSAAAGARPATGERARSPGPAGRPQTAQPAWWG
jgi:hypothetical protein